MNNSSNKSENGNEIPTDVASETLYNLGSASQNVIGALVVGSGNTFNNCSVTVKYINTMPPSVPGPEKVGTPSSGTGSYLGSAVPPYVPGPENVGTPSSGTGSYLGSAVPPYVPGPENVLAPSSGSKTGSTSSSSTEGIYQRPFAGGVEVMDVD